jgi:AcrR family transcriptional regulator
VERTSLDDVMAASGVSKSQLYHYFANKDALVLEVIASQTERVLDAQRAHLEALDSLPALKAWCDAIIRLNKAARGRPASEPSASRSPLNSIPVSEELILTRRGQGVHEMPVRQGSKPSEGFFCSVTQ